MYLQIFSGVVVISNLTSAKSSPSSWVAAAAALSQQPQQQPSRQPQQHNRQQPQFAFPLKKLNEIFNIFVGPNKQTREFCYHFFLRFHF